jgi:hypothetical protein
MQSGEHRGARRRAQGGSVSEAQAITIVSGLPRSGTSMLMGMLQAGGLKVVADGIRTADEDNPKGYFEFERAKALREGATGWLDDAQGKAVKVLSQLLLHLPAEGYRYRVLFLRRHIEEVLASQRKMLVRRGKPLGDDAQVGPLLEKHVADVLARVGKQPAFELLVVEHRAVIADPTANATKINAFLGGGLDEQAMAATVDPSLHRQRRG